MTVLLYIIQPEAVFLYLYMVLSVRLLVEISINRVLACTDSLLLTKFAIFIFILQGSHLACAV